MNLPPPIAGYSPTQLNNLPLPVLYQILSPLSVSDLVSFCRTSARIGSICRSRDFWNYKYVREFGQPPSSRNPIIDYISRKLSTMNMVDVAPELALPPSAIPRPIRQPLQQQPLQAPLQVQQQPPPPQLPPPQQPRLYIAVEDNPPPGFTGIMSYLDRVLPGVVELVKISRITEGLEGQFDAVAFLSKIDTLNLPTPLKTLPQSGLLVPVFHVEGAVYNSLPGKVLILQHLARGVSVPVFIVTGVRTAVSFIRANYSVAYPRFPFPSFIEHVYTPGDGAYIDEKLIVNDVAPKIHAAYQGYLAKSQLIQPAPVQASRPIQAAAPAPAAPTPALTPVPTTPAPGTGSAPKLFIAEMQWGIPGVSTALARLKQSNANVEVITPNEAKQILATAYRLGNTKDAVENALPGSNLPEPLKHLPQSGLLVTVYHITGRVADAALGDLKAMHNLSRGSSLTVFILDQVPTAVSYLRAAYNSSNPAWPFPTVREYSYQRGDGGWIDENVIADYLTKTITQVYEQYRNSRKVYLLADPGTPGLPLILSYLKETVPQFVQLPTDILPIAKNIAASSIESLNRAIQSSKLPDELKSLPESGLLVQLHHITGRMYDSLPGEIAALHALSRGTSLAVFVIDSIPTAVTRARELYGMLNPLYGFPQTIQYSYRPGEGAWIDTKAIAMQIGPAISRAASSSL